MNDHGFKFHDDHGLELPLLVLAIRANREYLDHTKFNFKPGRKFIDLQHQTAGHACHQVYLRATVLTPREPGKLFELDKKWFESDIGCFGQPLDEVLEYRAQLKGLFGLDCNRCYQDFEEAVYPIDCSSEALKKLCTDELPEDLDDLIEFKDNWQKMCGCIGRWGIYVLGENCD